MTSQSEWDSHAVISLNPQTDHYAYVGVWFSLRYTMTGERVPHGDVHRLMEASIRLINYHGDVDMAGVVELIRLLSRMAKNYDMVADFRIRQVRRPLTVKGGQTCV